MGGMTQRSWTPTKRRGPIAAEYSSPGPACVTLPPLIGKLKSAVAFHDLRFISTKRVSNFQGKPRRTRSEAEHPPFLSAAGKTNILS